MGFLGGTSPVVTCLQFLSSALARVDCLALHVSNGSEVSGYCFDDLDLGGWELHRARAHTAQFSLMPVRASGPKAPRLELRLFPLSTTMKRQRTLLARHLCFVLVSACLLVAASPCDRCGSLMIPSAFTPARDDKTWGATSTHVGLGDRQVPSHATLSPTRTTGKMQRTLWAPASSVCPQLRGYVCQTSTPTTAQK